MDRVDAVVQALGQKEGDTVAQLIKEMDKALDAFKVYAQKVPTENDYTMDHSASVLLFDAKGQFVETIRYQEDHDVAVAQLRKLLGMDASS